MVRYFESELPGGSVLRIEVAEERSTSLRDASAADEVLRAEKAFHEGLCIIDAVSQAVHQKICNLAGVVQPDEFSIDFGIKLCAEAGVLLAKASAESHLQVTMVWKRHQLATHS